MHNRPSRGIWMAPGRVNLIGEHTDYNDGYVLPFALPQHVRVAARRLDSYRWTIRSTLASESVTITEADLVPGRITGWAAYVAGVIWALRDAGYAVPGADLAIDSTLPTGAGLSSSAALECAVLTALAALGGLDVPVVERPRIAQRAENAYVGVPCGVMDQSAATLCRPGYALFLDCRTQAIEHIAFDAAAAGLAAFMIDTGRRNRHVDDEYASRRRDCERAARLLGVAALRDVDDVPDGLTDPVLRRRVRHVVTENRRVLDCVDLLRAGRIADIGPLLTASQASMRDDYQISVPEIDVAVAAALRAGALGARMTGGGFGGCVLALVDADAVEAVAAAVTAAFSDHGYPPPLAFVAVAAAGAGRVPDGPPEPAPQR